MSDFETATIFMHDGAQAVRLPKGVLLPGHKVRVRRVGHGVMLEPIVKRTLDEIKAIFAELDKYRAIPFMENGREQPSVFDDDDTLSLDK